MRKSINDITNLIPSLENLKGLKMEKLEWLWPERIPLGKITMLVGDPGVGKSFWTLDVAAHVSTGKPWPGSSDGKDDVPCGHIGSVILVTAEDDANDTILPRLTAAGADIGKISILRGMKAKREGKEDKDLYFDLKRGMLALENAAKEMPDLRLIILDPITAYMGDINCHDNAEVRSILDRLAAFASKHKVSILAISHLNKNEKVRAAYRIMGSVAFTAVSRMVWHIVKDSKTPNRRLLLPGKNNMCQEVSGMGFTLESVVVGEEKIDSAVCRYEDGEVHESADEALSSVIDSLASTQKAAAEWLKDILGYGPVAASDILVMARKEGISEATLRRVKKQLQVKSEKGDDGQGMTWMWKL